MFLLLQPVYGFAAAGDLIYVNAVEFWTGKNPINGKPSVTPVSQREVFEAIDGTIVGMTHREDGSVDVEIETVDGELRVLNLSRANEAAEARGKRPEVAFSGL